jgi:hypothetical protein
MRMHEQLYWGGTLIWLLAGIFCLYRGGRALLVLTPARAALIYNGYRQARREADGAFIRENPAPMPLLVEDVVAFTDHEGRQHRVTLRRLALPHDDNLLVWYPSGSPLKASAIGPVQWIGLFCLICGGYILLWWI